MNKNKIIIFVFFLIVLSSLIYAYSLNTFSDGTSTGNITFTTAGSKYYNLSIPYWATITKAEIDLRGYKQPTNYTGFSFSVANQISIPLGIAWNGSSFFVSGSDGGVTNKVYEYNSSGNYTGFSFDTADVPNGIVWSGGSFFVLVSIYDMVYEYDELGNFVSFAIDVSDEESSADGIAWNGSSFFVVGSNTEKVFEYNSSGNYTGFSFSLTHNALGLYTPNDVMWVDNYFYIVDSYNDAVYEYNSSGNYTNVSFSVSNQDSSMQGIVWNGISSFAVGGSTDKVFEYIYSSYPVNLTIDTGNDGATDYENLSTFNGTVTDIDLNITSFQNFINSNCNESHGNYCNITINFTSATAGILEYSNLEVNYGVGFDIYIYDESDNSTIEENISVLIYTNESEETYYTNSSVLTGIDLSSGEYAVSFHVLDTTLGYGDRTYIVTIAQDMDQYLTAYLEQNQSETTFTVYDKGTSELLEGVLATMYKFIGSWAPIEAKYTDITGTVKFSYTPNIRYKFFLSHSNYENYVFYLDPVQFSSYDIKMVRSLTINETPDYDRIAIIYAPTKFYANQDNNFTFIIQSPYGELLSYGYDLTYPGGTSSSFGNNVIGSALFNNFTITGSTNFSTLRLDYYYTTAMAGTRNFTYYYPIITGPGPGTMVKSTDPTYGLGLGTRLFIAVFIVILIVGIASFVGKPIPGLALGLIVFGYFVYTEFIPLWSVLISFAVGLIIIGSKPEG